MLYTHGRCAALVACGAGSDTVRRLTVGSASRDAAATLDSLTNGVADAMPVRSALIVDDEALVAMAIAEYFRDCGVETLEAFEPLQALDLLNRHPQIEALVTDVRMPGMNGPELVRQARCARPDLAVLFITGYAAEADLVGAGDWPVLHKPFDLSALGPALRRAMALR